MDKIIEGIITILENKGLTEIAKLLGGAKHSIEESSYYGSMPHSVLSTLLIITSPKNASILTDLSKNEKDEIIRAAKIFYPVKANSPEINKVIFQTKIEQFETSNEEILSNTIKFFVDKNPTGQARYYSSHKKPSEFPSFVLAFNDGWNDYSSKNSFYLFYYESIDICKQIGHLKIMIKNEYANTIDSIPEIFLSLDSEYCSLGQESYYYFKLNELLPANFLSITKALRDAAFDVEIQDKFEKESDFVNSLIRSDSAERLLRQMRYLLASFDMNNLYKFKYKYTPKYSQDYIEIDFDFDDKALIPNRIFAIIGKNGCGKTQLITSLPLDISRKNSENFKPSLPIFSKVIAVSYSIFDKFEIPKKTSTFNYIYCGLRNSNDEDFSMEQLSAKFYSTWDSITFRGRTAKWKQILLNFIEEIIIDEFLFEDKDSTRTNQIFSIDFEEFDRVQRNLSSGQSIILYVISEIIANIRYDSILLFDEPETHLHPNAISQLMNTILDIVNEFQSFCIITTHSPLIIRELLSRNVYVMSKTDNIPDIKKIGIESFGENLGVLTDEVFGNKDVPKHYKKTLQKFVNSGMTYDDILSSLKDENIPMSLNLSLYLNAIINAKKGNTNA